MLELLQMLPRIQWGRIHLPFCYHEATPQECFTGAPRPASAPFFAISWSGCWRGFPARAGKLSSCEGNFIQISQGQPNPETLKNKALWENSLLNQIPLSKRPGSQGLSIPDGATDSPLQVQNNFAFPSCWLVNGTIFTLSRNPCVRSVSAALQL